MKMQRLFCAFLSFVPVLAAVPGADAQVINTYAGGVVFSGVPALTVPVSYSEGIAYGSDGNVYFSDLEQCTVDRYDPGTQTVTQVAGNNACGYSGDGGAATSASLDGPYGVALDASNNLYIVDEGNNVIRRVDHTTGFITTVAGTGTAGYTGDGGAATSAKLMYPFGVALDVNGNLYIADSYNSRVRAVNEQASAITVCGVTIQPGAIQTVAGIGTAGYNGDNIAATSAEVNCRGVWLWMRPAISISATLPVTGSGASTPLPASSPPSRERGPRGSAGMAAWRPAPCSVIP